nr:lamin tail domain-containing protein 2 isoform X2 [Pan troglodytes]
MLGPPSGCWSLSGPPAKLSSGSASHTSSRLGWPRTHPGAWSGVSLEAPGNKQPHPFWVLVSMATVYSPSLPGLLGGRASEQESVSGHLGPPAGAPAAPETPTCLPDTTPHPAPVVCSADPQVCCCCRLALESLDPRTLRLLWRQRELEIQALRWAVQNGEDARLCHILEEVAGLPPKRSSHSQEKLLQNQVQKLTQELKKQKERAQWEKEHLEERLLQTTRTLQEMEAELQNLQKSCLLQLARSSWVGRMLRSQTGSVEVSLSPKPSCPRLPSPALPISSGASAGAPWPVWKPALLRCLWNSGLQQGGIRRPQSTGEVKEERCCGGALSPCPLASGPLLQVVTAETLMDPSDLSENIQAPTGEGFRLEDVDWNSVARRYPNLFTNMEPSSKQKQPRPWPQLDTGSPESSGKYSERHHKTVEWGSLPCLNTSSSGGADSDSSSCRPGLPSFVQVIGHPPRDHRASSEQALVQAGSYSRDSEDLQKTHSPRHGEPVLSPQPCTDPDHWSPELLQSPTGLKIVAVSCREKFVRIFNPSQESTADLSGMVLKQLVRGFPQRLYRFPPGTVLAPRHHVTVRPGPGARPRRHGPDAPHPPLRALPGLGRDDPQRQEAAARVLEPGARSPPLHPRLRDAAPEPQGRGRCGPPVGRPGLGCGGDRRAPQVLSEHRIPRRETPAPRVFADGTDLSIDRFPLPEAGPGADTRKPPRPPRPLRKGRVREPRDAGPAAPNELGEALPRAGGACAAREPRDPRATAPARHPG